MTDLDQTTGSGLSRRTVVKGAAWSLPAIALAVGAPAASASVIDVNVGDFSVDGQCGLLGVVGTGFSVTAGATVPLPVGTVLTVTSNAVLSVAALTATGATAAVALLDENTATFTLTSELAAGATAQFRTFLTVDVISNSTATLTLPSGFVAGDGAKDTGTLSILAAVLCNDN